MKTNMLSIYQLLLFAFATMLLCMPSCEHSTTTEPVEYPDSEPIADHIAFQVVKFTQADYANKVLATPYIEDTLVRRDGATAYYAAKLDSFELSPSCRGYICKNLSYMFGNQPYIDMGNGYLLVHCPWTGLISRYDLHIPVLLDIDWKELKSPFQRWAIDDVTVLAEAPFAEYYGFTSQEIDRIYGTRLEDILQAGTCQVWEDGYLIYDFKNNWNGRFPCGVEEYPELYAHLLDVQHQYERMIIELFQSGKYKDVLKENSKDVEYISLEELKKDPI
mgnify:CR=1 FL=1